MCCRVHLWTVIFLYLLLWSAVVSVCCSLSISTSYRGFAISLCCLVGWSEAYKIFVFWQSQDRILFIVLCVLLLCCVFSGAVLCCLCCLLWKCVKYQDRWETYPRVVYILRKSAYVGRWRMCSIFMIRVKFECSERLLLLYHFSIYGYTASHITLVIIWWACISHGFARYNKDCNFIIVPPNFSCK